MNGALPVTLPAGELRRCAGKLGIEELPVVLGRELCGGAAAAGEHGDPAAEPAPELIDAVRLLGCASAELAARRFTAEGVARLCIAGDESGTAGGTGGALGAPGRLAAARRGPAEEAAVTVGWARSRAAELADFLGAAPPVDVPAVRALQGELQARLGAAGTGMTAGACAGALTACGIGVAADKIAPVLVGATAWAEIVRVTRVGGAPGHTRAALVVFDSPHGRLAATPGLAPGGALWTTFGPGDTARIARGIEALDALAEREALADREHRRAPACAETGTTGPPW